MKRALCSLLLPLLCACDPEAFLLDVGLVPGMRESYVQDCCACLASEAPPPGVASAACLPEDGGPARATCLCDASADACEEALLAGGSITLVGACAAEDGPCASACKQVLAFPTSEE